MPRVPRRAPSSPLRLIRRLLVAAMLLLVAAVAGLYWLGRQGRPEPEPASERAEAAPASASPAAAGREPEAAEATAAVLSEGFDYEQRIGGRPVFRLQGDRFTTDQQGRVALTGVALRLYREGEPYDVESERATYLQESQEASLEGAVRLEGPDGWSVETERLDLVSEGRALESAGRARFARGAGLNGGADTLRYDLDAERLALEGKVRLAGRQEAGDPRVLLTADAVVWERPAAQVVATGGVRLGWGASDLEAARIEARLLADESGFESATAAGAVRGLVVGGDGRRIRVEADRAEVAFEPESGEPRAVALSTATPREPARVVLRERGEGQRRLLAPEIRMELVAGAPVSAEARGGVTIEETAPRAPKRTYRGERATARFAGDAIAAATLEGAVEIQDGRASARGDRATLERDGELATLVGAPAVGRNERGELSAPRLVHDLRSGKLRAENGVRARFRAGEGALPVPADGGRREPIHVEARTGGFTVEPRGFEFEGTVQAVQGETLLFADRLVGDEVSGTATATGSVRTVWQEQPAEGEPKPAPTTVQSETLEYRREAGELRYRGSVRMRQDRREIRAAECVVVLDAEQRARRVVATGQVRIEDRESGRVVEGAAAEYDLETRQAVVTGEPVTIEERGGTKLQGRRALFDLETGTARLLSEKP
jgi:lipopolysaccharide export system protein LptA